jgi:hypothetical protein
MNDLVINAAADPNKSLSGGYGLLVFLVLVVIVVFLFRSMNRHLRKVRQINFDDDKTKTTAGPEPDPLAKPKRPSQPGVAEPNKPHLH